MMKKIIEECLVEIKDNRQRMKIRHPLKEIILLSFCAILSGCEDYEDIAVYGEEKIDFLREYFPYKNNTAGVSTISRLFSSLSPTFFTKLLAAFLEHYFPNLPQNIIPIDGKTSKGSRNGTKSTIHNLSAFAADTKLVLSHMMVDSKTNEITAIPEMISLMEIENSLITIDAMGCQRDIAELIIAKKADYILGLKGNQGILYKNTQDLFPAMIANKKDYTVDTYEETDTSGGGRIEIRKVTITDNIVRLEALNAWPGLKSVIRVERTREIKGKTSEETSYYICSCVMSAEEAAHAVRSHWAIENSLHWVLDVSFGDDKSRIRKDHAPENMHILRKIAANVIRMLKSNASTKKEQNRSFKKYQKSFSFNNTLLRQVLAPVNS